MTSKTKIFTGVCVAALLAIGLCVGLTACGKDECAHESVAWDTVVSATCTADGYQSGTCVDCGETVTKVLPALGHDWDDGVITKEATEDEDGEITYTCSRCGATKVETIEYEAPDENEYGEDEDEETFERVTAVEAGDSRLDVFSATELVVSCDGNTYTVSKTTGIALGDLADTLYGGNGTEHGDCLYVAFEINVRSDETLKITWENANETKVRAMYGEDVEEKLTNADGTEFKEADGVWIIDVTDHNNNGGSFKMTIEVVENGEATETYYVVLDETA